MLTVLAALHATGTSVAGQLEIPVPTTPQIQGEVAAPQPAANSDSPPVAIPDDQFTAGAGGVVDESVPYPAGPDAAEASRFPRLDPYGTSNSAVIDSAVSAMDAVQQQPTAIAAPAFSGSQPYWYGYSSPVRVGFYGGETYAEPHSFLSIDLFRPLRNWQFSNGSEQLRYLDARLGFDVEGGAFGNIGLGQRHYFANEDVIVDGNVWYDIDDSGSQLYHQVAGGGQIQNQNLLLRGHYYFPFADTENVSGYTTTINNPVYVGNNIGLERYRLSEQAYRGFDAEIGLMFPMQDHLLKWFVGYYNFEADEVTPIEGVSSTIMASFATRLDLGLQVTYDDQSEFGYLVTVAYDFYNGPRDPAPNIRHRLGESVRRNRHILRRENSIYDPEIATAANGSNINVIHVSSAGNSSGTFESPYANLSQAATDAAATADSIILVHANSVLTGQSITVPAGTRLLGETGTHTVATSQFASVTLPRATAGTARAIIRNSPATTAAITLADNVEVNSIAIESAGAIGLFGTGLTGGTSILNTTVNGATTGLHISSSTGTIALDNIGISNTSAAGLRIENLNAGAALTFNNALAISNSGSHGMHLERNAAASTVTFNGPVTVSNSTNHGIFFDDNTDSSIVTFNGATAVNTTGGSGVFVSDVDNGTASAAASTVQFVGALTISDTAVAGITADQNNSDVSIQNLAISDWDVNAINIANSSGDFTVANPLALSNANGALTSTISISTTTSAVTFGDVTITDTSRAATGAAAVALFNNNTGLNDITFNSLNVVSTNGAALRAQDVGGSNSRLIIGAGVISATGDTAVDLELLNTDITLQSVSASNTTTGIRLVDVGSTSAFHRQFQIVGVGTTAGSGGVTSNVDTGVLISGTEDVSLALMNIDARVAGIRAQNNGFNDAENLTLDRLLLTDSGGTANWVGIDVRWDGGGAHTGTGTTITNSTITGTGTGQTGIRIVNVQSNPEMDATIGGNTITLLPASTGISLSATGFGTGASTLGDINLIPGLNNVINGPTTPFVISEAADGDITGQIRINGTLLTP